jgi:amino-acid N-acetyltransferase
MIRKAKVQDVKKIQRLINYFAKKDLMLPRSLNELYENIRDFWLFVDKKKILGCCALHVSWQDLGEIKSLAVDEKFQRKGIGKQLVVNSINESETLGIKKIFVLTYKPKYFKKFGFKKISHSKLPHKIWVECINCHKFSHCQEIAMIKRL